MHDVIGVILGGGPEPAFSPDPERSKPAVPIGGKYRLIDIPISNCLNSNLRRIFVLTQYNSESLNKHISQTYKFDVFSSAFVSRARRRADRGEPRLVPGHGRRRAPEPAPPAAATAGARSLILSGDQLYQMDYREDARDPPPARGRRHGGGDAGDAPSRPRGFGILKVNAQGRIVHFEEKPPPRAAARPRLRGARASGPTLPRLDGHLHLRPRGARERARPTRSSWTSAAT